MKTASTFFTKILDADLVYEGDLCFSAPDGLSVSPRLDQFRLHDALLFESSFLFDPDSGCLMQLKGILPDFARTFEISFHDVVEFSSSAFNPADLFCIRELELHDGEQTKAVIHGEFPDQFFSFLFREARFSIFRLKNELSRADFGWQ